MPYARVMMCPVHGQQFDYWDGLGSDVSRCQAPTEPRDASLGGDVFEVAFCSKEVEPAYSSDGRELWFHFDFGATLYDLTIEYELDQIAHDFLSNENLERLVKAPQDVRRKLWDKKVRDVIEDELDRRRRRGRNHPVFAFNYAESERIRAIERIVFQGGKHAGKCVAEVPPRYLVWVAREMNTHEAEEIAWYVETLRFRDRYAAASRRGHPGG